MNFKNLVLNIVRDIITIFYQMKNCESILIYDISHKPLIGAKPLHIIFDKTDRFVRYYKGSKHLGLFGSEKYNAILSSIR